MKVKDLIAELQKLDQEEIILIPNNFRRLNFEPFTEVSYIVKREMQYRNDMFLWAMKIYDEKKYPPKEVYVLQ